MTEPAPIAVIVDGLNPAQTDAVFAAPTPTLIVAGAGSGKTRVLTARVAVQIIASELDPRQALISAFTKAAANEMQERLGQIGVRAPVATFHSHMWRFIADERNRAGLPPLQVCTDNERAMILKSLCGPPTKQYPQAVGLPDTVDVSQVGRTISGLKNHLRDVTWLQTKPALNEHEAAAVTVWPLYESELAASTRIDFDDMLVHAWRLLTDPEVLTRARTRWTGFHIDEGQDTNVAQWTILEMLADPASDPNITVVGDSRQCIYQFRGAEPDLFDTFSDRWRGAHRVDLTVNYRSTNQVVDTANRLVTCLGLPDLRGVRGDSDPVETMLFSDPGEEAAWVASYAANRIGASDGIAVLARTNAQFAFIERALVDAGVPYTVRGGGFFSRLEAGDMVAYLRAASGTGGLDGFYRIINRPTRYLGKAFVDAVGRKHHETGRPLLECLTMVRATARKALTSNQVANAAKFRDLLTRIAGLPPADAVRWVRSAGGYQTWLDRDQIDFDTDRVSRTENLDAFEDVAAGFSTIDEFLEFVDRAETTQTASGVELSTVHAAKGREWSDVIVVGVNDRLLPHHRSVVDHERRLGYVAVTRARDRLVLTVPLTTPDGEPCNPSPFLRDAGLDADPVTDDDIEPVPLGTLFDLG